MSAQPPLLDVQGLSKSFGAVAAVRNVSLAVPSGGALALIGQSGCGKTTLLKLINRLIEPDTGFVRLGGDQAGDVPAHLWRRRIGYVLQGAGLFPHRTVADNIMTTPRLLGWEADRAARKCAELLEMVGLSETVFGSRSPSELSGGQAQRVGLARALAGEPDLVLMDEPFAALDPLTKDGLITDIKALRETLGFSMVLVTHDFAEALRLADTIAVMDAGEIIQAGTARELIANPASGAVRSLLAAPERAARAVSAAFDAGGAG